MTIKNILNVKIDPNGVFKYILIKVIEGDEHKLIVRGYAKCHYHADIFELTEKEEGRPGLVFKCLGGGRIKHESPNKSLFVYGYSQGFGRADHQKTVQLLEEHFKDYKISYSNEGY